MKDTVPLVHSKAQMAAKQTRTHSRGLVERVSRRPAALSGYDAIFTGIVSVLEAARRASARAVNTVITATYWEIGRRIVEGEQKGASRAEYGDRLLSDLSRGLTSRFGRGFSKRNLEQMRAFYLAWPIAQTLSAQFTAAEGGGVDLVGDLLMGSKLRAPNSGAAPAKRRPVDDVQPLEEPPISAMESVPCLRSFPLPWSHYVRPLTVEAPEARAFYETEALRGGWSVRQLDRQIASKFYERTLLSRNKAAMLRKAEKPLPADVVTPEEELKDPFVLEFLNLKDEYSESDLEEALIRHLESFLLELGGDFTFVGRQRRLRIGNTWYRIDLLFFHRRLRCLVLIDLKLGEFTHADAGQMHLYLNYAREHWTHEHENPPVGLILCSQKDKAVAHYALEGLPNKVLASEYKLALPSEEVLVAELIRTQKMLSLRGIHS